MEWILYHFVDIFKYSTGLLLAWGIFTTYNILTTMVSAHKQRGFVRKMDIMYFVGLSISTLLLFSTLFVFKTFTSDHMFAIFIFEVWYSVFAAYFTIDYICPCMKSNINNSSLKTKL